MARERTLEEKINIGKEIFYAFLNSTDLIETRDELQRKFSFNNYRTLYIYVNNYFLNRTTAPMPTKEEAIKYSNAIKNFSSHIRGRFDFDEIETLLENDENGNLENYANSININKLEHNVEIFVLHSGDSQSVVENVKIAFEKVKRICDKKALSKSTEKETSDNKISYQDKRFNDGISNAIAVMGSYINSENALINNSLLENFMTQKLFDKYSKIISEMDEYKDLNQKYIKVLNDRNLSLLLLTKEILSKIKEKFSNGTSFNVYDLYLTMLLPCHISYDEFISYVNSLHKNKVLLNGVEAVNSFDMSYFEKFKYIYFEGNTKLDENAISRFTLKINDREMTSEDRDIIIKDLKARNIKITRNTISSAFENMIHKTLEPKREKTV